LANRYNVGEIHPIHTPGVCKKHFICIAWYPDKNWFVTIFKWGQISKTICILDMG